MITKVRDEVKAKGYSTYSNEIHYNKDLTMNARYLFLFILSLPTDYDVSTSSLVKMLGEGKAKINSALRELKDAGYLVLTQRREGGKLTGNDCEIYELPHLNPNFNKGENPDSPFTDFQQTENQLTENQTHINKINNKENLNINKIIISPSSSSEGNPQVKPEGNKQDELALLFNETGQSEGAERVSSAILKLYGHMSLSILKKAIELSLKKDFKNIKDQKGYILTTLSDWNSRGFETLEQVENYLSSFRKPSSVKKPIRVEQKPDWLNQPQQSYDKDREYTAEELEIMERMKEMQKTLMPLQTCATDDLPF